MTSTTKILVPASEAAAMLSMGKSTFWRKVAKGVVPQPVKIDGLTRWRVADLLKIGSDEQASPDSGTKLKAA